MEKTKLLTVGVDDSATFDVRLIARSRSPKDDDAIVRAGHKLKGFALKDLTKASKEAPASVKEAELEMKVWQGILEHLRIKAADHAIEFRSAAGVGLAEGASKGGRESS